MSKVVKIFDYVIDPEDGQCVIYSRDDQGNVTEEDRCPHDEIIDKMNELINLNGGQ